jgi:D-sedoheptulose 7-phosphate isomerase
MVYSCGNGGSASQSAHLATELVGRFKKERSALRAVSLTDNAALLTALANDYSYDDVFAHQIAGLARPGDVLLALSTSGNSECVVRACRAGREAGAHVIGLTGRGGGRMGEFCDRVIAVDHDDTPLIQEIHLIVIHVLCETVESEIFG